MNIIKAATIAIGLGLLFFSDTAQRMFGLAIFLGALYVSSWLCFQVYEYKNMPVPLSPEEQEMLETRAREAKKEADWQAEQERRAAWDLKEEEERKKRKFWEEVDSGHEERERQREANLENQADWHRELQRLLEEDRQDRQDRRYRQRPSYRLPITTPHRMTTNNWRYSPPRPAIPSHPGNGPSHYPYYVNGQILDYTESDSNEVATQYVQTADPEPGKSVLEMMSGTWGNWRTQSQPYGWIDTPSGVRPRTEYEAGGGVAQATQVNTVIQQDNSASMANVIPAPASVPSAAPAHKSPPSLSGVRADMGTIFKSAADVVHLMSGEHGNSAQWQRLFASSEGKAFAELTYSTIGTIAGQASQGDSLGTPNLSVSAGELEQLGVFSKSFKDLVELFRHAAAHVANAELATLADRLQQADRFFANWQRPGNNDQQQPVQSTLQPQQALQAHQVPQLKVTPPATSAPQAIPAPVVMPAPQATLAPQASSAQQNTSASQGPSAEQQQQQQQQQRQQQHQFPLWDVPESNPLSGLHQTAPEAAKDQMQDWMSRVHEGIDILVKRYPNWQKKAAWDQIEQDNDARTFFAKMRFALDYILEWAAPGDQWDRQKLSSVDAQLRYKLKGEKFTKASNVLKAGASHNAGGNADFAHYSVEHVVRVFGS
ncbi:hypothetical protein KC356_g1726 [Hortaea werneckii]|nr:hypothetical protein KC356_g1726 [Hortaea werneckii]